MFSTMIEQLKTLPTRSGHATALKTLLKAKIMSQPTKQARLHFLDGLRGWGAVIVLLYHTFVEIYPVTRDGGRMLFHLFPFNGGLAIFVFFIVSGYALSIGFLQRGDRAILEKIFIGRYFRLAVPITLGCLIVYLLAQSGLLLDPLRRESASDLASVMSFALYGTFLAGSSAPLTPIPQLWTMPFEAFGSILILGLLWIAGMSRIRFLFYAVLLWGLRSQPMYAAFIVGALLAETHRFELTAEWHKRLSAVATVSLIPALLLVAILPGNTEFAVLCVSTAVATCAAFSGPAREFLSNPLSRFLASISFPLYILHGAVIYSLGTWLQGMALSPIQVLGANCTTIAAAILVAWMFRWIDTAGIYVSRSIGSLLDPRAAFRAFSKH